jgi:gas vesicle protein
MTLNKSPWYEIPSEDIPLAVAVPVPDDYQEEDESFRNNNNHIDNSILTTLEADTNHRFSATVLDAVDGMMVDPIPPISMLESSSSSSSAAAVAVAERPLMNSTGGSFEVPIVDPKLDENETIPSTNSSPKHCRNRRNHRHHRKLKSEITKEFKSMKQEIKESWKELKHTAKEEWKAEQCALKCSAKNLTQSLKDVEHATKEEAKVWKGEIRNEVETVKDSVATLKWGVLSLIRQVKLEMKGGC